MRVLPLLAAASALGCSGVAETAAPDRTILVIGSDMGPRSQNILLTRGNVPLTGSEVLVNGTVIPEVQAGRYAGQLPTTLPPGAPIEIMVISGADTVVGSATVPSTPALVQPAVGSVIHIPTPLDFSWTDVADPDAFRVAIQYNATAEVANYGPSIRAGIVVTSRIPTDATNLSAYVYAYRDGAFTGPANPASRMRVRQASATVPLVLGP